MENSLDLLSPQLPAAAVVMKQNEVTFSNTKSKGSPNDYHHPNNNVFILQMQTYETEQEQPEQSLLAVQTASLGIIPKREERKPSLQLNTREIIPGIEWLALGPGIFCDVKGCGR